MKNKLSGLRTSLAAVLAVSYWGTQCLFAYQPEKSFWTERRSAAERQSPPLLASVPVGHTAFELLANQFPSTQQVSPALSTSVAETVPKGFIKDHAPLLSALSPSYGSIRKVCLPKPGSPPGPLILHIQDVHMNQDAQRNIGETVRALMESGQVDLIALEGSTEEINLQPFADTPHRQAVQMTADYLLRENKISGPIHAALTHAGQLPRILGIDDSVHYEANVQAYRTSAPTLEKTRQELKGLEWEMEAKKKTVFSPALFAYDQIVQAYRAGRVSLGEYVKTLTSANASGQSNLIAGSSLSPSIRCFLDALKMEQTLDFKKVESERTRLLDRLTRALTTEETNALLAQSLAYRSGQLRYADFYGQLKTTCQKNGIPLNEFPSMDAYVRYVLLADKIDAERLLEDIGAQENTGYTRLIKTPEEKDLVSRTRQLWLTTKLVDFSLIPSEWQEYQTGDKWDRLHSFESFYVEAQARDTAMANNLLRAIKESPKKSPGTMTILVTGGYHAKGMADQLTAQGATVISYVPKIEKIDTAQGAAYLSVFSQEKTPLEKLVQGKKLFLAADPAPSSLLKSLVPGLIVLSAMAMGSLSVDPSVLYTILGGAGLFFGLTKVSDIVHAKIRVRDQTIELTARIQQEKILSVTQSRPIIGFWQCIQLGNLRELFMFPSLPLQILGFDEKAGERATHSAPMKEEIRYRFIPFSMVNLFFNIFILGGDIPGVNSTIAFWLFSLLSLITGVFSAIAFQRAHKVIITDIFYGHVHGREPTIAEKRGLFLAGLFYALPYVSTLVVVSAIQSVTASFFPVAYSIIGGVLLPLSWVGIFTSFFWGVYHHRTHNQKILGPGQATGWIGVSCAYVLGWAKGALQQTIFRTTGDRAPLSQFAADYVKEGNGRRAAIAEDAISTLVATAVGIWVVSIVGTPMCLDWKLFLPASVAIVWPLVLLGSHVDPEKNLQNLFGIHPSDPKAKKLSMWVFGYEIVVAGLFVAFRIYFPLIWELMFFFWGVASFLGLRAFHKDLNGGEGAKDSGDKKTSTAMFFAFAVLPFLGFAPDLAEGVVRLANVVNTYSILGVLTAILVILGWGLLSLVRLNNTSSVKPPEGTVSEGQVERISPLGSATASDLALVETEVREAFARFAKHTQLDPTKARFSGLRKWPGNHYTMVIFLGESRFIGQAAKVSPTNALTNNAPPIFRARILSPPAVGETPQKPKSSAQKKNAITPIERKVWNAFKEYASLNHLDIKKAHFHSVRPAGKDRYSVDIEIGDASYKVDVEGTSENGFSATVSVPQAYQEVTYGGSEFITEERKVDSASLETHLTAVFNLYAARNHLNMEESQFTYFNSSQENKLSLAVNVEGNRFVAEALRYSVVKDNEIKVVTEIQILTPDEVVYENRIVQGPKFVEWLNKVKREIGMEWARWHPSLQPNNILFLSTGKWAQAGFVVDAVFLLGMAATGASLWGLLPSFAVLHVLLEVRSKPDMLPKERVVRFLSHLLFALPYGIPDFSAGFFHVVPLVGSAVAVGLHAVYDQYTIGLDDGRKLGLLKTGLPGEKINVLLGGSGSVTGALMGGVISKTPEFLNRVSRQSKGFFYSLGLRHGMAQIAGENADIPIVEKPVGTPEQLTKMISLASEMHNFNEANPSRPSFLTVTPFGGMTVEEIDMALTKAGIPGDMVYVKKISGPLSFAIFGNEFEMALRHFNVHPENMFLILAGKPEMSDLSQWAGDGVILDALRQSLLKALLGTMPVIAPRVILDMMNGMSLAETSA